MKLPYSWLRDYTAIEAAPYDYAHRMTMTGSKVEGFSSPADSISGVVCARLTAVEKHPDSDHLHICQVDAGAHGAVQVVSGAPNLNVGDLVPLALVGAKLPGGGIAATVMRGVVSDGMLCSFQELGLTEHDCPYADASGILVFPADMNLKPGDCALKALGLDEVTVEFEITPNRPDCLSILGLARETAASYSLPLSLPQPAVKATAGDIGDHLAVEIADADLCFRYTAGMATDIKIAPSPQWMRDRLRAAGIRPINNIVDITNYVMLEYGQPMHAFDYGCIEGRKIIVRRSIPGEQTVTLDGQTRNLADNTLLITDPTKAIGIAGVMGGENSEITENTRMIVFESATFSGPGVRAASRKIGMRTEASGRFEKGLDSENTLPALMRALELVEQLGAGQVLGGIIDVYPAPKQPRTVELDSGFINRLLGIELSADEMAALLRPLGFGINGSAVTIPSWRDDAEGVADLAEEVARMYGFERIPATLFETRALKGGLNPRQQFEKDLMATAMGCGFFESRSVSFMSAADLDKIQVPAGDTLRTAVRILNPLGEEQSLMRTTLLPALLEAAGRNVSHRVDGMRLFEMAMTYHPQLKDGAADPTVLPNETKRLCMAMYGDDFYTLKGTVEAVLTENSVAGCTFIPCSDDPSYHPGRTAGVYCGETALGVVGEVHPLVLESYGIDTPVYVAELDVDALWPLKGGHKLYAPLPRYPAMTRDLAVVCDAGLYAYELEQAIRESAGPMLTGLEVFDVYTGAQVPQGKKSVAYALTFRSPDHTLVDSETDALMTGILAALESRCGAVLRG